MNLNAYCTFAKENLPKKNNPLRNFWSFQRQLSILNGYLGQKLFTNQFLDLLIEKIKHLRITFYNSGNLNDWIKKSPNAEKGGS